MTKPLRILVDLDDVLWELLPHWASALNAEYGYHVTPEEITEWEMQKSYPTLKPEDIYAPVFRNGFWREIKPSMHGSWFINRLTAEGHKINVATSSHYQNLQSKMERLFELYPMLSWKDVTITSQKQTIKGDALLDDLPANLVGGDYYKILMDKPHNHAFDAENHDVIRVKNLKEAYNAIINNFKGAYR
jgi:5'(3')-deoxyribonucleotidase